MSPYHEETEGVEESRHEEEIEAPIEAPILGCSLGFDEFDPDIEHHE